MSTVEREFLCAAAGCAQLLGCRDPLRLPPRLNSRSVCPAWHGALFTSPGASVLLRDLYLLFHQASTCMPRLADLFPDGVVAVLELVKHKGVELGRVNLPLLI